MFHTKPRHPDAQTRSSLQQLGLEELPEKVRIGKISNRPQ